MMLAVDENEKLARRSRLLLERFLTPAEGMQECVCVALVLVLVLVLAASAGVSASTLCCLVPPSPLLFFFFTHCAAVVCRVQFACSLDPDFDGRMVSSEQPAGPSTYHV